MRITLKNIIYVVITVGIFVLAGPQAYAGYGAGTTNGWDVNVNGLKGTLTGYNAAPNYYDTKHTITVTAQITNTSKTETIQVPTYLYVSKVLESPLGSDISDGSATISESTLFSNNLIGSDSQQLVLTQSLKTITLAPSQSTTVSSNFSLESAGYYQVDISTLSTAQSYTPGYIIGAGFIRVINVTSDSSSDKDPSGDEHNDLNSGTSQDEPQVLGVTSLRVTQPVFQSGTEPTTLVEVAGTAPAGVVEGASDTNLSGDVLGANSCSEKPTMWWLPVLLALLSSVVIGLFVTNKRIASGLIVLTGVLGSIYAYIKGCSCGDVSLCKFSILMIVIASILGIGINLFFSNKRSTKR